MRLCNSYFFGCLYVFNKKYNHFAITILHRKELKLSYIFILPFISVCVAYYSNGYQVISVKMGLYRDNWSERDRYDIFIRCEDFRFTDFEVDFRFPLFRLTNHIYDSI